MKLIETVLENSEADKTASRDLKTKRAREMEEYLAFLRQQKADMVVEERMNAVRMESDIQKVRGAFVSFIDLILKLQAEQKRYDQWAREADARRALMQVRRVGFFLFVL
jgi:type IV secretory pathway VirB4 component